MKPSEIYSIPHEPQPYAVLGDPINHSLSPLMQQAAFDHLQIAARYYRIEANEETLPKAVERMRQVGFGGWNCTVPNKVRMYELCDERAESAEKFRAVNTVVVRDGRLIGHNTDGIGWSRAVQEAFGRGAGSLRILLLGAGGAGRAIATQALSEGCPELVVVNRDLDRGLELAADLQKKFPKSSIQLMTFKSDQFSKAVSQAELIVNATSGSLKKDEPPILSATQIRPGTLVLDTVYGPASHKLQREVQAAQAEWSDGLGMLLHQGAEAFSLWTERPAPIEVMKQALASVFSASQMKDFSA